MRQIGPQLAKFSRTRYMNYVRSKFLQHPPCFCRVPPKPQVVPQIALDRKTHRTARQFQSRHATVRERSHRRPAMHRQKWPPVPRRERHQLPHRKRNSIDLLKCFAKERHAWFSRHNLPAKSARKIFTYSPKLSRRVPPFLASTISARTSKTPKAASDSAANPPATIRAPPPQSALPAASHTD